MNSALRLVLVEDEQVLREHLILRLQKMPGIEVCGEAESGAQALEVIRRTPVDCVLLDLQLPDMNGLEVMSILRSEQSHVKFIILSAYCTYETVHMARKFQAASCLPKQHCGVDLLDLALKAIADGRVFYPFGFFTSVHGPGGINAHVDQVLSAREQKILIGILSGRNNAELAAGLGLSVFTVKNHRNSIMRKLGVHGAGELLRYAHSIGLAALYTPPRRRPSFVLAPAG